MWSGLEILLFLSALCGVGWDFVPRRPPGLAGFVGPRTLKRRVVALGRGVAREHDGYMAGAFCLCSGSGVRLAATPLAVCAGGVHLWPVWWNLVDTPHSKCGALWGVRVRVPPRVLVC